MREHDALRFPRCTGVAEIIVATWAGSYPRGAQPIFGHGLLASRRDQRLYSEGVTVTESGDTAA